nr:MAG TPA: hypothetical protein [Caudoviricetes sp.]
MIRCNLSAKTRRKLKADSARLWQRSSEKGKMRCNDSMQPIRNHGSAQIENL